MTLPHIIANQPATPAMPASFFDDNYNSVGAMGVTQCTAAGTNAIILTPVANQTTVAGYVNQQIFSFVATASSTGAVTAQVGALAFVQVFLPGGTIQAGSGQIVNGQAYLVMFLSALNAGAGGLVILSTVSAATLPRGQIAGLTLSKDATLPNTVLDISPGQCDDSTHGFAITLGAFTKSTGGVWVAGTGLAGMGTGLTIANSTWYHVHAILNAGLPDVYFDTSVTAANKPTGTTAFRRIGSFLTTGAAAITPFFQNGEDFIWDTYPALDVNATNPGTAAVTATLNGAPPGVRVRALLNVVIVNTTPIALNALFSSLDVADTAPSETASPLGNAGLDSATSNRPFSQVQVWTNAAQQIRYRLSASDANVIVRAQVAGWTDLRGRLS